MYSNMKSTQFGFFDEADRLQRLNKLNDPLVDLANLIDFEMFRPTLAEAFAKLEAQKTSLGNNSRPKSPAGRKPMDPVFMFKILILQRSYNLSDQQAEFQLVDRSSFRRFLGINAAQEVPDFTTVWRFREALQKADAIKPLFDRFTQMLREKGLILNEGVAIDASFVEVPRQRNTSEENEMIKQGIVPPEWKENPRKLCQKDLDARWAKKGEEVHYGYKDHAQIEVGSKFLTDYRVSDAAVHDSQLTEELITEEHKGQPAFADSAYKSEECDERLEALGVENFIHEKGARGRPLSELQKKKNTLKSQIRCRVEHVFGFMENSMGGLFLRYIGMARNLSLIHI
mgnify:FL=1